MNEVIYTNRGCILLQCQNPTAALQDFASALYLAPHLDEAWVGKGTALYQLGRFSEAHDSFSQALALNHPLAQTNLDLVQQHLEVKKIGLKNEIRI
jgi:Flp pilus assembly protein TadD